MARLSIAETDVTGSKYNGYVIIVIVAVCREDGWLASGNSDCFYGRYATDVFLGGRVFIIILFFIVFVSFVCAGNLRYGVCCIVKIMLFMYGYLFLFFSEFILGVLNLFKLFG